MAHEVRLSGPENEPLGIVPIQEALRLAGEYDVDLVEIAATANPPVCRLMDYGKFKYLEQKRAAEAKAKQTVIEIKEVKFRPGTDDGDYNIKLRNIRRFLGEGNKCKITLRFRGREITHQQLGLALLKAYEQYDPLNAGTQFSGAFGSLLQGDPPTDDVLDYFAAAVGGDSVPACKPAPGHLLSTAQRMGLPASGCLYVGDSAVDQHTARAAGIPFYAVPWGSAAALCLPAAWRLERLRDLLEKR